MLQVEEINSTEVELRFKLSSEHNKFFYNQFFYFYTYVPDMYSSDAAALVL